MRDAGTTFIGFAGEIVLGVVIAIGLRAAGIVNEIVPLAFGPSFGTVGSAVALAAGSSPCERALAFGRENQP